MFSGLWFLCPRVIVVDEHFKDVTKDFNQCPDVLVHSVAFFLFGDAKLRRLVLHVVQSCTL